MSDETPDANDLLIAGRPLVADGEVVVPIERARARRDAQARTVDTGGGGEPPPFDAPPPGDDDAPPPRRGGGGGDDDRPVIVVTTEEAEVNDEACAALARDASLYVRGTSIVRVIVPGQIQGSKREADAPTIDFVPESIIQERLAANARFVKKIPGKRDKATGEVTDWIDAPVHPPKWCVQAVRARGEWSSLRRLEAVVETAVLRPDGTVLTQPGYDPRSGILLRSRQAAPPVPEHPTAEDVSAALAMLNDVVCDVFWARPAHRSTWLASVLTPLARPAFDGPAPLFLFEAPVAGSGKGLLVDVAVRIATGRPAPFESYTTDNEELKKQIVTWASSGRSIVVFDEVSRTLDGAALRSVLTAPVITGRLLGLSKDWTGPNRITWYATGNNVSIGNEMFRRIAPARILSPTENPAQRSGFRHADLRAYVTTHALELRRAALTILRAYCDAGQPEQKLSSWGSFEGWSALVRSAIVWAGWEDPSAAVDELREVADTRQPKLRALASLWVKLLAQLRKPACTAKDAFDHVFRADPGPLPELRELIGEIASDKQGRPSAKALGYVLRSLHQRIFFTELGEVGFNDAGTDRKGSKLWSATVLRPAGDAGDAGHPSVHLHARDQDSPSSSREGKETSPASPASPAQGDLGLDDSSWDSDDEEPSW